MFCICKGPYCSLSVHYKGKNWAISFDCLRFDIDSCKSNGLFFDEILVAWGGEERGTRLAWIEFNEMATLILNIDPHRLTIM